MEYNIVMNPNHLLKSKDFNRLLGTTMKDSTCTMQLILSHFISLIGPLTEIAHTRKHGVHLTSHYGVLAMTISVL